MKLLVQSDDYGITRAVSLGIIHGIQNGIVRNTGLFANMIWAKECVEWIRPYFNTIAFGIDLNASTGPSLLGHDRVPTLTHEDGTFLGSKENRALDTEENGHDHLKEHRDELYAEFKAQIERYIELVGHKPDYIHNHAYGTPTTAEVTQQLRREYDVKDSPSLMESPHIRFAGMGWYVRGGAEAQLNEDPINYVLSDQGKILNEEYGYLITHCGYADANLFPLSSYTLCRVKDLECLTSDAVKQWVKDNSIELITFRDLPESWFE